MLSRDLRSQASPLCPEEESQIAKIRSPLTPQGEDVKLTAVRGGPQHCQASPVIPKHIIEQKEGSYPCVVEVVGCWV